MNWSRSELMAKLEALAEEAVPHDEGFLVACVIEAFCAKHDLHHVVLYVAEVVADAQRADDLIRYWRRKPPSLTTQQLLRSCLDEASAQRILSITDA